MTYTALGDCPDERAFTKLVTSRLRRSRLVSPRPTVPVYQVTLGRIDQGFSGELRLSGTSDTAETRQIHGDTCEQVAVALAVVTALAMDAHADAPSPPPQPEAPREASIPAKPMAAEPPPPATPRNAHAQTARVASEGLGDWTWGIAVRGYVDTPKAPAPLPGGELRVELEAPNRRLAFFVAAGFQYGTVVESGPGRARFSWLGGRAGAYYLVTEKGASFGLSPSGFAEAGRLTAKGFIAQARTVHDPWVAVGMGVRGSYTTGAATFSVEGGPVIPITSRDRYVFGDTQSPSDVVFDVPAVGGFLAVGAALRL